MSRCNCFDERLDVVAKEIRKSIPEGAKDVKFEWQNHSFFLNGGDYSPVNPRVQFEYRAPKRGGGHAKNMTRDSVTMAADFCPFCGRKLAKNEEG